MQEVTVIYRHVKMVEMMAVMGRKANHSTYKPQCSSEVQTRVCIRVTSQHIEDIKEEILLPWNN